MPPKPDLVMGRYLQHLGKQWLRENGNDDGDAHRVQLAKAVNVSPAQITELLNTGLNAGTKTAEGFAALYRIKGSELRKRAEEFYEKSPPTDNQAVELGIRSVLERRARLRPDRFVEADIDQAARAALAAGVGVLGDKTADRLLESAEDLREIAERSVAPITERKRPRTAEEIDLDDGRTLIGDIKRPAIDVSPRDEATGAGDRPIDDDTEVTHSDATGPRLSPALRPGVERQPSAKEAVNAPNAQGEQRRSRNKLPTRD